MDSIPDPLAKGGMDFLLEVTLQLTKSSSLDSLWAFIVSNALEITLADYSSLYLFLGPSGATHIELKAHAPKSSPPTVEAEAAARAIANQARDASEPFVIAVDRGPTSGSEASLPANTLVTPILVNDTAAGALVIERSDRAYSQADVNFLRLAAGLAAAAIHHDQVLRSERELREFAEALRDAAAALTSTLSLDEVLDRILNDIKTVVHHDAAHVMLVEAGVAQVVRASGYAEIGLEELLLSRKFIIAEVPHLRSLYERGEPIAVPFTGDASEWANLPEESWIRSYAGAPIRIQERIIGFLSVDSSTPGFFTPKDARRLQAFADQAAIALQNARLHAQVQHLAMTDELTGLLNRRGLLEEGKKEIERCQRYRRPLSAVLIDIDRFKEINDRYGHGVGDEVIQWVADHINRHVRSVDLVGRIGGDEIFILLPETPAGPAVSLAERIRTSIRPPPSISEQDVPITLSLGVYEMKTTEEDLYSLLMKSDRALYQAKQGGRNRVEVRKE